MFELLVPNIKTAFLGRVTCAFSDKAGGSGGGVRRGEKKREKKKSATGAAPRAAMIQLSVSSCHSRPEQLWKHRKDQEEGEEERQSQILLC